MEYSALKSDLYSVLWSLRHSCIKIIEFFGSSPQIPSTANAPDSRTSASPRIYKLVDCVQQEVSH